MIFKDYALLPPAAQQDFLHSILQGSASQHVQPYQITMEIPSREFANPTVLPIPMSTSQIQSLESAFFNVPQSQHSSPKTTPNAVSKTVQPTAMLTITQDTALVYVLWWEFKPLRTTPPTYAFKLVPFNPTTTLRITPGNVSSTAHRFLQCTLTTQLDHVSTTVQQVQSTPTPMIAQEHALKYAQEALTTKIQQDNA